MQEKSALTSILFLLFKSFISYLKIFSSSDQLYVS